MKKYAPPEATLPEDKDLFPRGYVQAAKENLGIARFRTPYLKDCVDGHVEHFLSEAHVVQLVLAAWPGHAAEARREAGKKVVGMDLLQAFTGPYGKSTKVGVAWCC